MMLERARFLDAGDPLREFRDRFMLPDGVIYLDGNSLGCLPKATPARLEEVVREEWGRDLIRSWNTAGWIDLPARLGAKIAPLIGARPHEVIACDSTSVNLFKLISAALAMQPASTSASANVAAPWRTVCSIDIVHSAEMPGRGL